MFSIKNAAIGVAAALTAAIAPASATTVDLELQFLVDVSGSISTSEFNLQRSGYSNAFRNSDIQNAILNGDEGAIAVQLIYWSSSNQQLVGVDWTLIDSVAAAEAFADDVDAAGRPFSGGTQVDYALTYGVGEFTDNGFDSDRQVIDVSGDGASSASATAAARDAALAAGIDTINALAIQSTSVQDFFTAYLIGGAGAFAEFAATFADFEAALVRKIGREITGGEIPVPAAFPLLITGLAGLGFFSRRKKTA